MSVEFESPATRVIEQFSGKDEEAFRIPTDLPDITFLRALSVQGRLRYFTDDTTITPVTGETFFLYRTHAKGTDANNVGSITVRNDGNTRMSIQLGFSGTGSGVELNIIDSLVGNGIKQLVINVTNASCSIYGWVENTSRIRDVTI